MSSNLQSCDRLCPKSPDRLYCSPQSAAQAPYSSWTYRRESDSAWPERGSWPRTGARRGFGGRATSRMDLKAGPKSWALCPKSSKR